MNFMNVRQSFALQLFLLGVTVPATEWCSAFTMTRKKNGWNGTRLWRFPGEIVSVLRDWNHCNCSGASILFPFRGDELTSRHAVIRHCQPGQLDGDRERRE